MMKMMQEAEREGAIQRGKSVALSIAFSAREACKIIPAAWECLRCRSLPASQHPASSLQPATSSSTHHTLTCARVSLARCSQSCPQPLQSSLPSFSLTPSVAITQWRRRVTSRIHPNNLMMADVKREYLLYHQHHYNHHPHNFLPTDSYFDASVNDELWDLKNVSYPGFENFSSDPRDQFDNNNLLADLDSLSDTDHLEDVDYVKNIMMQIQTTCAPVTANHFALHNHHSHSHMDFGSDSGRSLGETHVLASDYGSEGAESDDEISDDGELSSPGSISSSSSTTAGRTSGSHIYLWQFLKELLAQPQLHGSSIRWLDRAKGVFKIEDSVKVARLWGKRKNRPAMNYDKLSRSIRQYYKKGIMKKTERSQRLVYQFCHPYSVSQEKINDYNPPVVPPLPSSFSLLSHREPNRDIFPGTSCSPCKPDARSVSHDPSRVRHATPLWPDRLPSGFQPQSV